MYTLEHRSDDVIDLTVAGHVTDDDYDRLIPQLEREIAHQGGLRVLLDMTDMDGIEPKALWRDLKFDMKHRNDYERVAVVGDQRWHDWATRLFQPIAGGEVRYFDASQRDAAERWIEQCTELPA